MRLLKEIAVDFTVAACLLIGALAFWTCDANAQYIRLRDDGVDITRRQFLNFGAGITCADDSTTGETDCRASGGGSKSVEDCGASGADSIDDTSAIQACITSICQTRVGTGTFTDGYGGTLTFPKGRYIISDTLTVTNCQTINLEGAGRSATVIEWENGTTGKPMLKLTDSPYVRVQSMLLKPSDDPAIVNTAVIDIYRTDDVYSPSYAFGNWHHTYRDLWLGGWDNAYYQYGVLIHAESALADGNNDFHVFDRVRVDGPVIAGLSVTHTQSVGHALYDCYFSGGQYAVTNALGVGLDPPTGGSFRWYGGATANHSIAAFYIQTGNGSNTVIEGANSEGDVRFLSTAGVANNGGAVSIRGNRYSADSLHADGDWILTKFVGSFHIEYNYYCDGATQTPTVGVDNGGSNNITMAFVANTCTYAGSDAVNPISWSGGSNNSIFLAANTFTTSGGIPVGKYDGWNGALDDRVLVGNGGSLEQKAIADCDDSSGSHLNYDTATNAFSCGTSIPAALSATSFTSTAGAGVEGFKLTTNGSMFRLGSTTDAWMGVNAHGFTHSQNRFWVGGGVGTIATPATEDKLVVTHDSTFANILFSVDNASPAYASLLFGDRGSRASGVLRYDYANTRMEWAPAGTRVFHVTNTGEISSTSAKTKGTITLSSGTGTATVVSGATCTCSDTSAVAAVQCSVTTTTLTANGTGTDVIAYHCIGG